MINQEFAQLDPKLLAVMTAVKTLQQDGGPKPGTVAAQVMEQAQQGIAGMMPPQGGHQGLPRMLANAQQAAPSVAQNAQQGQVNQMAQQVAQRMQEQQQPPGVTGLPGLPAGNMGFSEGGIIPSARYNKGGEINLDLTQLYGAGIAPSLGIAGALPAEPENADIAELRRLEAERAALAKQRIPELYNRGTQALGAARSEMETAQQQALKERGMDRLMAVLGAGARSRYGAGEGYLNFQEAARKSDALYAQQKQLNAMQQLEQDKYRYSLETGSMGEAANAVKNMSAIKDKLSDNAFQIKQLAETARGTDVGAAVNREQIASADARSKAARESQERIAAAKRAADERIASLGQDKLDKAQNLKQYLDAMNAPDMKKLAESVAAAEKFKLPAATELRKQLNEKRANYAKYYKLTPQEAASAFESPAPTASPAAGGTPADVAAYLKQYGKGS